MSDNPPPMIDRQQAVAALAEVTLFLNYHYSRMRDGSRGDPPPAGWLRIRECAVAVHSALTTMTGPTGDLLEE